MVAKSLMLKRLSLCVPVPFCPSCIMSQSHCVLFPCGWERMGSGHTSPLCNPHPKLNPGIGTQRNWSLSGTWTQWDCETKGLGHNGIGTQWDWNSLGFGHDWGTKGLEQNQTGTQLNCGTTRPGHNSQLASWCFKPSQPQRIISGLKETFIERYIVKRTNSDIMIIGYLWHTISEEPRALPKADKHIHFKTHRCHTHTHTHKHPPTHTHACMHAHTHTHRHTHTPIRQKKDLKNRVRKCRVVRRIYAMKYSWKGLKDRNKHKDSIKRSEQARLVYVRNINHSIPTTRRWARGDAKGRDSWISNRC